jgi:hypothetical protein
VKPEEYRLLVYRKVRTAQRTLYTLDPDYRSVDDIIRLIQNNVGTHEGLVF